MQAKDVMTTTVVVTAQALVRDVARRLLERAISAVPVVDAKGRVQGIVSEGDLIRRTESGTESRRSWWLDLLADRDGIAFDYVKSRGRTAEDVMTRKVITVGERTPLAKIAMLLERHRIKRVPVLRSGKVVGIVSRANLLHGLVAQKTVRSKAVVSDREIRSRILKELDKAGVDTSYVNVIVANGVAELWGFIETDVQKRALRVAVKNMKGVKRVVDNVTVIAPMLRASLGAE
jgi:CBS-domain-containing membrane protein